MKKIKTIITGFLLLAGLVVTPIVATSPSFAVFDPQQSACEGTGGTWNGTTCTGNASAKTVDLQEVITNIVNILLYVIGAIAVVMIIFGAFRFVTSAGNASSVTAAKNTILYAVIGLVVAILAYAIVNFVLKSI